MRQRSASPPWKRSLQPLHSPSNLQKPDRYVDSLPSISYLDMEKIKGEAADYSLVHASSAPTSMAPPLQTSPSNLYSGPPPPYSYPSSSASSVVGVSGYISPPESRRTSDDDKEPPSHRQSLPSIHEALGRDQQILYTSKPPPIIPPLTALPPSLHTPTTPIPRSHPEAILSGPPNPYATSQASLYSHEAAEKKPQTTTRKGSQGEESTIRAPRLGPYESNSHLTSSPNPSMQPNPHLSYHPHSSPMYHPSIPVPTSMPHQPTYYSQPAYSFPQQSPNIISQHYQYVHPSSWRADGSDIERAEETRKAALKGSPKKGQHYGESVKRHLDIFDLETSLNEVSRFKIL